MGLRSGIVIPFLFGEASVFAHDSGGVIGVIFNPTARGERANRFRDHLSELGDDVRVLPTRSAGDARTLAADLTREGFGTLVAAGGDGTVNEVLNGICDVPEGLARTRLGVIPLGTVNVFAKEMAIPEEFQGAWRVIREGRDRWIDLPRAEFTGATGDRELRHFILMAGAGLDSRAIGLVDWGWKRRVGPLAYVWAGIRAMKPPHPSLEVRIVETTHRVELAEVGNGRFYGGRFPVFPKARLDDGVLDVTLFPRVGLLCALRVFLRLVTHRLTGSRDAVMLQGREITLTSEEPVPLQLDGDLVGHLPATLTVQPRALRVVAA